MRIASRPKLICRLTHLGLASLVGLAACGLLLLLAAGRVRPAQAAPAAGTIVVTTTIQAAINGAANGDTILIHAGRYTESLTLNKPVSLTAFGDGPVTIVAVTGQRVLTVTGPSITNSTVISGLTFTGGNSASAGGGIRVANSASPLLHSLVITNNRSANNGGGLAVDLPGSLTLVNTEVLSNSAQFSGGGVWSTGGAAVNGGRLEGNQALAGSGGGLMVFDADLAVTGTAFLSNTVADDGAGLYQFGTARSTRLTGATLQGNTSPRRGGGAYVEGALTLDNVSVVSNTATLEGGGVYARGTAVITSGAFLRNQVLTGASLGGGLLVSGTATISGTQLISNTAEGPFLAGARGGQGGGLYANSALTVNGAEFIGNRAGDRGGGALAQAGAALSGGLFQSNRCFDSLCSGGGLLVTGTVRITATQFLTNRAEFDGGGLFATGALTVTSGYFQGNQCTNTCKGGGLRAQSTLLLSDTQFLSNIVRLAGGGAAVTGPATVLGGWFEGNRCTLAACSGGGLSAEDQVGITGTIFLGNQAVSNGSALVHHNGTGRLVNVLFASNIVTGGSVLRLSSFGAVTLLHVTVATPTLANGQAIVAASGPVYITNTIITSHTVAISTTGSASAAVNYSLLFGNTDNYRGSLSIGGNVSGLDPRFSNPAAGDYHLTPSSPAVHAGLGGTGVSTDFEGDPRPLGPQVDIGYDEEDRLLRFFVALIWR
jgi:predicted outer membrane repeat protein